MCIFDILPNYSFKHSNSVRHTLLKEGKTQLKEAPMTRTSQNTAKVRLNTDTMLERSQPLKAQKTAASIIKPRLSTRADFLALAEAVNAPGGGAETELAEHFVKTQLFTFHSQFLIPHNFEPFIRNRWKIDVNNWYFY